MDLKWKLALFLVSEICPIAYYRIVLFFTNNQHIVLIEFPVLSICNFPIKSVWILKIATISTPKYCFRLLDDIFAPAFSANENTLSTSSFDFPLYASVIPPKPLPTTGGFFSLISFTKRSI